MDMGDPPKDWSILVIRFIFAAIFFGFLIALIGIRYVESVNLANLGAWFAITSSVSFLAAWFGDEAWLRLIGFLRWW